MIQKVEMYQAVCDRCGKKSGRYKSLSRIMWVMEYFNTWNEIDGKIYCRNCVEWDQKTKSYKPKGKEE